MKQNLLRFNNKQKYIFFDFETCNLNLSSLENKPWQLAFAIFEGEKQLEVANYYIYWKDLNISEGAKKVTGFSKSKYKKEAKPASDILSHFDKYMYDDDYLKCGHNILGFDVYIHNIFRRLLGFPTDYSYIPLCIDTLCLARAINNEIPFSDDRTPWQLRLNSLRKKGQRATLGACCKRYQIETDESKLHDALYDIKKNHQVFRKQIWDLEI